jgi:hypothetical protein
MRKRRGITPDDAQRWIKQGFGQGQGQSYRPFFNVRDVPSRGRSCKVLGIDTGRIHHYLSDLEYYCHVLVEYDQTVTDIREQYALLPYERPQWIARTLGLKYPTYPGTKTPIVMTSDLVLTVGALHQNPPSVLCVKPSKALDPANPKSRRTLEKLAIEKIYWDLLGCPFNLVTEHDIPIVRAKNLIFFRTSIVAEEFDFLNTYLPEFPALFDSVWAPDLLLMEILGRIADILGLDAASCFCLTGRAVWLRLLDIDIDTEILHHHQPVRRNAPQGGNAWLKSTTSLAPLLMQQPSLKGSIDSST